MDWYRWESRQGHLGGCVLKCGQMFKEVEEIKEFKESIRSSGLYQPAARASELCLIFEGKSTRWRCGLLVTRHCVTRDVKAVREQRRQRVRENLACGLAVRWALLPVCFGESKAETGKSAHLTAEEVKEFKEVASFRSAQRAAKL
jgi:hypothetical protein